MLKEKIEERINRIKNGMWPDSMGYAIATDMCVKELNWVLSELDKMKCDNCLRQCGYGVKPKAFCESFEERK